MIEETGRQAARRSSAPRPGSSQPPQPGDPIRFLTTLQPGPGPPRRLLLPGARSARAGDAGRDRRALPRLRAPRRHADEPHRRRAQAAALPDPAGTGGSLRRPRRHRRRLHQPAAAPGQGPLPISVTQLRAERERRREHRCARSPTRTSTCASTDGSTRTRADDDGRLVDCPMPLPVGLEPADARAGDRLARGRRLERELPVERDRRRRAVAGRAGHHRAAPTSRSTRPARRGAVVFYPDVTARARDRRRQRARRLRARRPDRSSGVGRNDVLCTATDPATGARRPGRVRGHRRRRTAHASRCPTSSRRGGPADRRGADELPGHRVRRRRQQPVARVRAVGAELLPARRGHAGRVRGRPITRIRSASGPVHGAGGRHDAARRSARCPTSWSEPTRARARSSTTRPAPTTSSTGRSRPAAITRRGRSSRSARRW